MDAKRLRDRDCGVRADDAWKERVEAQDVGCGEHLTEEHSGYRGAEEGPECGRRARHQVVVLPSMASAPEQLSVGAGEELSDREADLDSHALLSNRSAGKVGYRGGDVGNRAHPRREPAGGELPLIGIVLQIMYRIILPQAMKIVIPPLGNQFVNLVKNSSVLAFVAGFDLMYQAQLIAFSTFQTIDTYIIVGLFYLILTLPLSYYMRHLEKKLVN